MSKFFVPFRVKNFRYRLVIDDAPHGTTLTLEAFEGVDAMDVERWGSLAGNSEVWTAGAKELYLDMKRRALQGGSAALRESSAPTPEATARDNEPPRRVRMPGRGPVRKVGLGQRAKQLGELIRSKVPGPDVWGVVYRRRYGIGVAMICCNGVDLVQWCNPQAFAGGDGDRIYRDTCPGAWVIVDALAGFATIGKELHETRELARELQEELIDQVGERFVPEYVQELMRRAI